MSLLQAPHRRRALRLAVASIGLAALGGLMADTPADPLGEKAGGNTTVFATGRNAFSFPAANLDDAERTRFVIGNSFFRRNWVEAPASTKARDGLGPHFIARSCGGCHVQDGRGEPPAIFNRLGETKDPTVALLIRLSIPGTDAHGGPKHDPVYGDQFNNAGVQGVKPEGRVTLRYKTIKGKFADGTPYELLDPSYGFADLGYGPMHPEIMVSPRIAPQIIGVGLLEAIAEADILANAADQAAAGGPIKGVPNRVWDAPSGQMMLGRFGWKGNVATIAHQTGGAFQGDMGITSKHFSNETCTPPLARRKRVRMVELHRMPMALLPASFATRQMLDECFRSCGADPQVVAEINTLAPMMELVGQTQLASIVAANVVTPGSGLVVVRLESPTPVRTPGMLWSPVARESVPTRAFSTIVRKLALHGSLRDVARSRG